jgi:hypothetical protein
VDYRLALLLEAPLGNTESAIADVTTVAVKVECVLKVPFVARRAVVYFRLDLGVGESLAGCDVVEQMVGYLPPAGFEYAPVQSMARLSYLKHGRAFWIGKGPGSR